MVGSLRSLGIQLSNQRTLVRVRNDKKFPNHRDVVCDIMKSIKDGVDLEMVSLQEAHRGRRQCE